MTLTQPIARMRISREIVEAETALNDALIKQSALFATLVTARRDTEAGNFTGQEALMRLTKSQQSLLAAGNDLARVHGRLLEIDQETGDAAQDCPDEYKFGIADEDVAA